ncbi:MAG: ERCC4 domain-containing protein [Candidatus Thorarchaeota archaeon]
MNTLIIDTREEIPWDFSMFGWENKTLKLDEGDYTTQKILDIEQDRDLKICRIERKSSLGELATNLGKTFSRFEREMERLQPYHTKFIILEYSVDEILLFPENTNMKPEYKKKVRVRGKFMLNRLGYIKKKYGVDVIFSSCREEAMIIAKEELENVERLY